MVLYWIASASFPGFGNRPAGTSASKAFAELPIRPSWSAVSEFVMAVSPGRATIALPMLPTRVWYVESSVRRKFGRTLGSVWDRSQLPQ